MQADAAETPASNDRRQGRSYLYDAFISYDHDDQPVAHGIQRGLHRIDRRVGQLPDGCRLASASYDGTVRLRNADTGQPLGDPLTGHTSTVLAVAFSPDGQRVASASGDKSVRLWQAFASPEMPCDKLTANMIRKQWREWVSPDIAYTEVCPGLPIAAD